MRPPSLASAVIFTASAFISLVVSVAIPSVALVGAICWPVLAVSARWAAYGIQRTAYEQHATDERLRTRRWDAS